MIRYLLHYCIVFCFSIASSGAFAAPACIQQSRTCVAANETRNIGGVDVTRECWQYQRTYKCVDPDVFDNCSAIASTVGCNQTSSNCTSTSAVDGSCLEYTNQYRCGDPVAPVPTGVVVLPTSYTITNDAANLAACAAYETNPSCVRSAMNCTSGPATRNINGLDVYKDCWEWKYDYTCRDSSSQSTVNTCAAIAATAGCSEQTSVCTANSTVDGSCSETTKTYLCADAVTPLPTDVVLLSTSYVVVSDALDESACTDYASNPLCTRSSTVCVDGPGSKVINGATIFKDCWKYSYTYICAAPPAERSSDCGDLQADPSCTLIKSEQAKLDTGETDPYTVFKTYKCETAPATTTTEAVCGAVECVAGVCPPPTEAANQDFALALANLESQRQAANYKDADQLFFTGHRDTCRADGAFGLRTCCEQEVRAGGDNSAMGSMALSFTFQAVKYFGTQYVFDPISQWMQQIGVAISAAYQSAVGNQVAQSGATNAVDATQAIKADPGTTQTAPSAWNGGLLQSDGSYAAAPTTGFNFGVYGFTFNVSSSGISYAGFNPAAFWLSVAILVYQQLSSCNQDEMMLSTRRGQGLCTLVGSYTSGGPLSRTLHESYCCYNSKLARIINEQGRPMLPKPFGDPKSEACKGFTQDELTRIDFSKIDFTEFLSDINSTAQDEAALVNRFNGRATEIKDNYRATGTGKTNNAYTVPVIKP